MTNESFQYEIRRRSKRCFGRESLKINPHREARDSDASTRAKSDLERLVAQPVVGQRRPCSGCKILCACTRKSKSCTCGCSNQCPEAPRQLSSEPERYPIEAGAIPMVYGLSSLRVISACWSCEGHQRADGSVLRFPQVWFYSDSIIYPQLLVRILDKLLAEKILDRPWRISLCSLPSSGNLNCAFLIEPSFRFDCELTPAQFLRSQRDFVKIGNFIESRMREIARQELERM